MLSGCAYPTRGKVDTSETTTITQPSGTQIVNTKTASANAQGNSKEAPKAE